MTFPNMRQGVSLCAAVIVLALAACRPGENQPDEPADERAPDTVAHGPTAFLGPVTYRYDPLLLTAANVRLAIPPADEARINALKLVPTRGITGGAALCPGEETACPVEDQPGLSMALLERPFTRYRDALQASELAPGIRPTRVGGAEGIAVELRDRGGFSTEYRLVPLAQRALLLKLQLDGESAAEKEALERVVASIDLGG